MIKYLILLSFLFASASRPLDLFVSPNGSDQNAGDAAHPFATVGRARDEIRKQKPIGAIVHIHGGIYFLDEPLTLTPEDSGSPSAPIVYEAVANESPILSGGQRIQFHLGENGWWIADLPDVRSGKWDFMQLFVNDQRRWRPRMPKKGYYTILGEMPPTEAGAKRGSDRFVFRPGEFKSSFKNLSDVEALCFSHWFVSRLRVASVDDKKQVVTFTGPTGSKDDYGKLHAGWGFIVENAAESLSEPGEFYLDRPTGRLTYIPMPGEKIESTVAIAPRLGKLLVLQGDDANEKYVHDVIFRGLGLEHANWTTPPAGHTDLQAEHSVRGAIYAIGAHHCAWERCRLEHLGTYGIDLDTACRDNRVEGCVLSDLGAGGIRLGGGGKKKHADAHNAANRIFNNLIIHGGRTLPGGIGIFVQQSSNNVVQHNEIADLYYTGISSGWTWGYGPSLATGNQYLDNYVHQIGQGVLSDMGGIYTLGNHAGSVIRGNRFEDVWCNEYGGWGIYFDEGTTGCIAENNWVRDTRTGGFHQHYGKDNVVRNNVFVDGVRDWLQRTRVEPDHRSFTFEKNIVVGHSEHVFLGDWHHNVLVDHNVYWRTKGQPDFIGHLFPAWQKTSGQDAHSILAEPGLADIEHGDFHVKPGSAAEQIGFQFFDARDAGLTGDMKNVERPTSAPGFPVEERRYDQP